MPQTTPTTSLATVSKLARRVAIVCTAVIVLSLAAASCATDEPLPIASLPAAEQPSETVADDDRLDLAPTTTFVADDIPAEAADTSGDAEPDPETAPAEPPTTTLEPEPESPPITTAAPEPESPPTTTAAPEPEPEPTPTTSAAPEPEPESTPTTSAAPEPEPESTPTTSAAPEPEPESTPTTSAAPEPEPEPTPTTTAAPEPEPEIVPGTEIFPEWDLLPAGSVWCERHPDDTVNCWTDEKVSARILSGNDELPDNMWCQRHRDGTDTCRIGASPIEPYAGYVPPLFPGTEQPSWEQGTHEWVTGPPPDRPRASTGIQRWTEWCGDRSGCEMLLLEMTWALDYLGASEDCVLPVYHARVRAILNAGQYWTSGALADRFGWHRCPTVLDPRQPTVTDSLIEQMFPDYVILLLTFNSEPLADQCRAVLPADAEIEHLIDGRISGLRSGLDCDGWARLVQVDLGNNFANCDRAARLAEEWMEHYYGMSEDYWRVFC